MKNSVILKIPSDREYFPIVTLAVGEMAKKRGLEKRKREEIKEAVKELMENAIIHAYKTNEGIIEVDITSFENGLRIDVRDWGEPLAEIKTRAVPINLKEDKGFNRVYKLTDNFEYFNLGKEGKKFSVIKFLPHPHPKKLPKEKHTKYLTKEAVDKAIKNIIIREYKKGDEESISKLIYRNYGYTYLKDLFYYPKKIAENENRKFFSVVAEVEGEIIGHFALIKSYDSNIAEVGVVVVDPRFKGRGIMGMMFDKLLELAKKLNFLAVFGEAIMFHIYSQKSNLSHGFCETALVIGRINEDTILKNNTLSEKKERGSVLIGYKVLHKMTKSIHIPKLYREKIIHIYEKCKNISYKELKNSSKRDIHSKFAYFTDPLSNTAVIVIDKIGKEFERKFSLLLDHVRAKHPDMIYADICMETIECIDETVEFLNRKKFFFSGVLFFKHKNMEYLRLQYKHSLHIGKKNLICYSNFCHQLLEYIKEDEKRVRLLS